MSADRDLWFYQCVGHMMVGELDKAQGIAERTQVRIIGHGVCESGKYHYKW